MAARSRGGLTDMNSNTISVDSNLFAQAVMAAALMSSGRNGV